MADGSLCDHVSESRSGGPCAGHRAAADAPLVADGVGVADGSRPSAQPRDSSPRARLARDVADGYETVRQAIFDGMEADKPLAISCPKCRHRFQARVPDHAARLRAADMALAQGFGKRREEEPRKVLVESPTGFDALSTAELEWKLTALELAAAARRFPDDEPGLARRKLRALEQVIAVADVPDEVRRLAASAALAEPVAA